MNPKTIMRKSKFLSLLKEKYGERIVEALLDTVSLVLRPENIKPCSSDPEGKDIVVSQMSRLAVLIEDLKLPSEVLAEFSFDFPGWVGALDFNCHRAKEILILGLEPHIESHYYQICYDLSRIGHFRITPHEQRGFWIRTVLPDYDGPDEKLCKDRLWDIMFRLFSEHTYQFSSNEIHKPDQGLMEILQRFYITDLCHFAPRGVASRISKENDFSRRWSRIQQKTANAFLSREICLINPKLIVAQGNASRTFFENIETERVESDGTFKNLPCKGKYHIGENRFDMLFIPHTSRMTSRFWNSCNVKLLRDEISRILAGASGMVHYP